MANRFGFYETQSEHFFKVVIEKEVTFYECYYLFDFLNDEKEELVEIPKAVLTLQQWELIKPTITFEFNQHLKEEGKKSSKFVKGDNYIPKLYGKELLLLVWGIELTNIEPEINSAIRNWKGFSREEKWWLFTRVNAASGGLKDYFGWRMGIKEVLLHNPTKMKI